MNTSDFFALTVPTTQGAHAAGVVAKLSQLLTDTSREALESAPALLKTTRESLDEITQKSLEVC
jgi:hypothetical protein